MTGYEFSNSHIEQHVEKVGVDVRPVIEVRADRTKLNDYAAWLTDRWPSFYESTVFGPGTFQLLKRFVFPGKGEIDFPTFALTNRGAVFMFPRLIAPFDETIALPENSTVNAIAREALKEFRVRWPQCKHIRIGKIAEYIFDCGSYSALTVLSSRFTKWPSFPANGELELRVNMPDDDYNRIIRMEAVPKFSIDPGPPPIRAQVGSGVAVEADVNNRDMSEDMNDSKQLVVLDRADQFFRVELFPILNGGLS